MSLTEELADAADAALAALTTRRTFEEARAALNEAGMLRARGRVDETLQRIEDTQAAVRGAQQAAKQAQDSFEWYLAEAEWQLEAHFISEGNKTYLVDGEEKRAMTADQRKEWKAREARKLPDVNAAALLVTKQDQYVAQCKDALVVAEKAFQAARIDLEAAIATVQLFAQSISTKKADDK